MTRIPLATLAFGLLLAGGCLPSKPAPAPAPPPATPVTLPAPAPEAPAPAPPPAPAPAAPAEAPPAPAAQEQKRTSLSFDTTGKGGVDVEVSTVPLEEGRGFLVTGSFGLNATLVPAAEGRWLFQGTIEFPTGGYSVGEPFTIPMTDVAPTADGVSVTQSEVQVVVQLPVRIPQPGSAITQAVDVQQLRFEFDAPAKSQFIVSMTSG